jgi:hypothetical protein
MLSRNTAIRPRAQILRIGATDAGWRKWRNGLRQV